MSALGVVVGEPRPAPLALHGKPLGVDPPCGALSTVDRSGVRRCPVVPTHAARIRRQGHVLGDNGRGQGAGAGVQVRRERTRISAPTQPTGVRHGGDDPRTSAFVVCPRTGRSEARPATLSTRVGESLRPLRVGRTLPAVLIQVDRVEFHPATFARFPVCHRNLSLGERLSKRWWFVNTERAFLLGG